MEDSHIPKDLLYGELAIGLRPQDDPNYTSRTDASETSRHLAYFNTDSWEVAATDRDAWKHRETGAATI